MTFSEEIQKYLGRGNDTNCASRLDFPYYTENGKWETLSTTDSTDWVSGFWPALWWLGAESNDSYIPTALKFTKLIRPLYRTNFNVGVRYQFSWIFAYEHTGTADYMEQIRDAGSRLLNCFQPDIGLLCHSPKNSERVASPDSLMNLSLLMWLSEYSNDSQKLEFVIRTTLDHAIKWFIKSSGGLRHRITFESDSKKIVSIDYDHGRNGGCWSRGLAWTIRSLILAGILYDHEPYLSEADDLVEYHVNNSYKLIPAYDYSVSRIQRPSLTDTSAAAILASALLQRGLMTGHDQSLSQGQRIINQLFRDFKRPPDTAGIIDNACFHYPKNMGVNSATIWGDYFAFESLFMAENMEIPTHYRWLRETPSKNQTEFDDIVQERVIEGHNLAN